MIYNLDSLRMRAGQIPTAAEQNDLVAAAIANRVHFADAPDSTTRPQHNWRVATTRLDDATRFGINPLSGEPYFSASAFAQPTSTGDIAPERLWSLTVGAGCVNDRVALIDGVPLHLAPRLPVRAPVEDDPGSFVKIADAARPAHFRSEVMFGYELYRSSVVVSGRRPPVPDVLLDIPLLPTLPTLIGLLSELAFLETLASLQLTERIGILPLEPPYQVTAGRFPANLDGQQHYRLADLWLLRRPGASPKNDRILVEQHAYWSLQAFSVLEDQALLSILPALQATGPAGNLTAQNIFALLLDAAQIRWWSK